MLQRIGYYIKRLKTLGFHKSSARAVARITDAWWYHYWKLRTQCNVLPALRVDNDIFLLCSTEHIDFLLRSARYQSSLTAQYTDTEILAKKAARICAGYWDIFGTSVDLHAPHVWHEDPRAAAPCPWYNPDDPSFALDITVNHAATEHADIKFPWELSRMQHLTLLGAAYRISNDPEQQKKYVATMMHYITSWITANPFMKGVNWLNTMEVAIRATNLICVMHYFKSAPEISTSFWKSYVRLLKQHQWYIETRWETSATPNNHYLADLVGHLHLLLFFSAPQTQVTAALMHTTRAFEKQILPDGWAYEGSTAYHQLDCEMLLHTLSIAEYCDSPTGPRLAQLYEKMMHARRSLTTTRGYFSTIGDDDSGQFVTGLAPQPSTDQTLHQTFSQAGISVINHANVQVIFRSPAHTSAYPSGHYHYDELSFTLAIDGYPFIIDPGSYCYTNNPALRRAFRSWESHNTVFCLDELKETEDLFHVTKLSSPVLPSVISSPQAIELKATRTIHHTGDTIIRTLHLAGSVLSVCDAIKNYRQHQIMQTLIFAPDVTVVQEGKKWILTHTAGPRAVLTSAHAWLAESWWQAQGYGQRTPCTRLRTLNTQRQWAELRFCIEIMPN